MTIVAIRAIVIIVVATVAGLIVMNVFIPGDNTALTVQIVGVVAPTTAALLSLINSAKNSEQIQETTAVAQAAVALGAANNDALAAHSEKLDTIAGDVDGKLSQLMAANVDKARLLGRQEGTQEERDRHGGT